jgi:transcriptional regulator with XRE-family HTH domain
MASKKLGELIRELRESKGLSQQALADRASITLSYVAILEAGQQGAPPRAILQRIARALGVPVEKLEEPQ